MKYVRIKAARNSDRYVKLLKDYEDYLAGTIFKVIKEHKSVMLVEALDGERVTFPYNLLEEERVK